MFSDVPCLPSADMGIQFDIGYLWIHHLEPFQIFFIAAGYGESFSEPSVFFLLIIVQEVGDGAYFGKGSLTGSRFHSVKAHLHSGILPHFL